MILYSVPSCTHAWWKGGPVAGVDPAVPPEELLEAHQRMRANPEGERNQPASDLFLFFLEFWQIFPCCRLCISLVFWFGCDAKFGGIYGWSDPQVAVPPQDGYVPRRGLVFVRQFFFPVFLSIKVCQEIKGPRTSTSTQRVALQ